MRQPIINLGILAHADAGKTTLTEQILWRCGVIREPGRVDDGTTQTDSSDVERRRGISVQAATVSLPFRDTKLNLIDTPGHVDFASEVERSLRVLDAAILVVSAADGVQSHTRVLWEALSALNIPTIFFLNKIDRVGVDVSATLGEINVELKAPIFSLELDMQNSSSRITSRDTVLEALGERDDAVLEAYIAEETDAWTDEKLFSLLATAFARGALCPALSGSALRGIGTEELLEALYLLAPRAKDNVDDHVSGLIYRVSHDAAHGRIAHTRLYGGTLRNRDSIRNATRDTIEKVFQIRGLRGSKLTDTGILTAGDIGAVYGLGPVRVGDILGDSSLIPKRHELAVPLLRVRVLPEDPKQMPRLLEALDELAAEDPLLESVIARDEVQVCITGMIQLEILSVLLKERFGLDAGFGPPSVIYKETPLSIAEGFEAYTMPKPCWAVIRFLIEPMPRGSGVQYECAVSNEKIHYRYQGQVSQTIPIALAQGPLGWEVTDLRVTLVDGEDHPIHTHPLDFALATPLAMMDGLVRAGTTLLEPMLRVFIEAPEEHSGRIIGDFVHMRGQFDAPVIHGGKFMLEGRLPVATSLDYPVRLSSATAGNALLSTRFDGYESCPAELGATAPHRGVDPRDRAKYILWKRSALHG